MLDVNKQIVNKLKTKTGLNVYYELIEHDYTMPCITYMTYDNYESHSGNTMAYSSIGYYIKLWGKSLSVLMPYMLLIDEQMKSLGYNRESYNEMAIGDEICLISQYRGLGLEERS